MRFFTSESVTEGHPDKVCDQIADAILDDILSKDPAARVACEVTATKNHVQIMGEITTVAKYDPIAIAKEVIAQIGYASDDFSPQTIKFDVFLAEQSPDIAMGVNKALEYKDGQADDGLGTGAGDQGMMFGIATSETPELMPAAITFAHKMNKKLAAVRKDGTLPYLKPDGKGQITVEYDKDGNIKRIDTVVLSSQHDESVTLEQLRKDLKEKVILKALDNSLIDENTKIYINPTGNFVVGGPAGDSGLTGRKIIVDTYGGYGRHGGGAFSGKDSTKVDRSGAYAARYVAKNIVAAGLAKKCEVQLSYAIGIAKPVSICVETFGTAICPEEKLENAVARVFDLRPEAIIRAFGLRRPIFRALATYGHMGREDLNVPWEKTDKTRELIDAVK